MTIDEMRNKLDKFCEGFDLCIDGCPLRNPDDGSCRWNNLSDISTEDCYHFLERLIGKPEQPEINFVKVERNDEVEPTNDAVQHPSHYTKKSGRGIDGAAKHMELCKYLNNLYATKNQKYGDSFSITVQKYGIIAALTRLSDKWQRFETLILTKDPGTPDESIRDTLLDMANYCIMTVMELDQKEGINNVNTE